MERCIEEEGLKSVWVRRNGDSSGQACLSSEQRHQALLISLLVFSCRLHSRKEHDGKQPSVHSLAWTEHLRWEQVCLTCLHRSGFFGQTSNDAFCELLSAFQKPLTVICVAEHRMQFKRGL